MMKRKILAIGAAGVLLISGCSNPSTGVGNIAVPERIQVENADSQVIAVGSRESVKVVPDIATIVYGITTQDEDAAACQDANSQKMNQLIQALKGLGIEEKSIRTSNYSLSPRQDWQNDGAIMGYEMFAELTVSDIPLERVGEILTSSVSAGVNEVQSISYLSSKYDESYQEALKQAVEKAEEKASALAEASGNSLGQVVRITEYNENAVARYQNNVGTIAKQESASRMAADMMPGEISIEASITVEYAIDTAKSAQ